MSDVSISVVIPCYNQVSFLARAIDSVLSQGERILEIIVVDDCSSEEDADSKFYNVSLISDKVTIIRQNQRSGAPVVRNIGISKAKGDLIALLDADDEWLPSKIKSQLSQLSNWNEQFADNWFSATDTVMRNEEGVVGRSNGGNVPGSDVAKYLLIDDGMLQTSTLIAPAALLKRCGFDERLKRHQDWDLTIRLVFNGATLCYVDDALSVYDIDTTRSRISLSANGLKNTLSWFSEAVKYVPATYLQSYFFRHAINRINGKRPFVMIFGVVYVISLSPISGFRLLFNRFLNLLFKRAR